MQKIQQAIGPHEDLLTIVERRKLQWYGHVSREAKIRLEEQSKKTESCRENLQLKGSCRQKQTQEQVKKGWASLVGLCQT